MPLANIMDNRLLKKSWLLQRSISAIKMNTHMSLESGFQLQALNQMMQEQFAASDMKRL